MKVTLRNREVFESEGALKQLVELETKQKLAYAALKNQRVINNEAQDLRGSLELDKEKAENYKMFEERRQIILADPSMTADKRNQMIRDLEDDFDEGIRFVEDDQNRKRNDLLKKTQELELWEMKWEWFPKKFKAAALGPMIEAVTGGDDGKEEDSE